MKKQSLFQFTSVLVFIALLSTAFNTNLYAQKFPVAIADSVDKWSEPVTVNVQDRNMKVATLKVWVKVKKFKGTTGECVVYFENIGSTEFRSWAALQIGSKANTEPIYIQNAASISLKPGEKASKYLELRECWPKGRKGLDAVGKCAACEPRICFAEYTIH